MIVCDLRFFRLAILVQRPINLYPFSRPEI